MLLFIILYVIVFNGEGRNSDQSLVFFLVFFDVQVKTEKEMNYICGWCNKMFLELSSFMLHTQQEKYLRVCCSKCDSKFCDLLDLRQHEASAHEKLPPEPGEKNPIVVLVSVFFTLYLILSLGL